MKRLVATLFFCVGCLFQTSHGKTFGKCELAALLETKFNFTKDEVKNWVCVAEFESTFNSSAINHFNWDGSEDYGLFQINNRFWCGDESGQNVCRIPCSALLDDDLTDDIKCAKRIKRDTERWSKTDNGLVAWVAYVNRCQTRDLDAYMDECWSTTTTSTTTTTTTTTTSTTKTTDEITTIKPSVVVESGVESIPIRASSLGTGPVKASGGQPGADSNVISYQVTPFTPVRASGVGLPSYTAVHEIPSAFDRPIKPSLSPLKPHTFVPDALISPVNTGAEPPRTSEVELLESDANREVPTILEANPTKSDPDTKPLKVFTVRNPGTFNPLMTSDKGLKPHDDSQVSSNAFGNSEHDGDKPVSVDLIKNLAPTGDEQDPPMRATAPGQIGSNKFPVKFFVSNIKKDANTMAEGVQPDSVVPPSETETGASLFQNLQESLFLNRPSAFTGLDSYNINTLTALLNRLQRPHTLFTPPRFSLIDFDPKLGFSMIRPSLFNPPFIVPHNNPLIPLTMMNRFPTAFVPSRNSGPGFFTYQRPKASGLQTNVSPQVISIVDGEPTVLMASNSAALRNVGKNKEINALAIHPQEPTAGYTNIQSYESPISTTVNNQHLFSTLRNRNQPPLLRGFGFPAKKPLVNSYGNQQFSNVPMLYNPKPTYSSHFSFHRTPFNVLF